MSETHFRLFEQAAKQRMLLRVEFMQKLPDDPALPDEMRMTGLRTMIDGYAVRYTPDTIVMSQAIAPSVDEKDAEALRKVAPERIIPRDRVLSVQLIGQNEASLPNTGEEEPPPQAA